MQCLRIISRLLDYPTTDLAEYADELRALLADDKDLSEGSRTALAVFLNQRLNQDLLEWQSDYDGLFERGRSVSLHLFEHVHGESRDRGQAMVDLLAQYREAGLELDVRELPDYLPLYLEFVATQGDQATGWLQDIAHVLALLTARLQERDSDYALVTQALLDLSGVAVELAPIREEVAKEERDDTPEALDRIWEEEVVSFTGGDMAGVTGAPGAGIADACSSGRYKPTPAQRQDDVMPVKIFDSSSANLGHR